MPTLEPGGSPGGAPRDRGTPGCAAAKRVVVLVPDALPGRFTFLHEMFAGTAVHVLRDRRRRDRRDGAGAVREDRRHGDRRRRAEPVGYAYGCAILALDEPASIAPDHAGRVGVEPRVRSHDLASTGSRTATLWTREAAATTIGSSAT